MFVKGQKHTKKYRENVKNARFAKFGSAICFICNKEFNKYVRSAIICGDSECIKKLNVYKYNSLKESDEIQFKALKLFSTIRMGVGKKDKSIKILKESLGKNCKYCENIITLDNASVDHKKPRTGSKVFNRKKRKMIYSYEEIKELDKEENLQIICRSCNQIKGDMTDEEFSLLLSFINNYPKLKEKLFYRFKMTLLFFGRKR